MRILFLIALLLGPGCKNEPPAVPLPAPWDDLVLPVGSGVVEAGPDELHIGYEGQDRFVLLEAYQDALVKDGWTAGEPLGMPGLTTVKFTRGDATLDLIVSGRGRRADVLITR